MDKEIAEELDKILEKLYQLIDLEMKGNQDWGIISRIHSGIEILSAATVYMTKKMLLETGGAPDDVLEVMDRAIKTLDGNS